MNNSIVLAISDGGKSLTVSLERRLASILLQPYGNKHTKTLVGSKMYTQYSFHGGGALECQGRYQARPKIHVIRVVFQDQALYTRTSFRGAKTCKIGKKRMCFWSYRQILERT